MSTTKKAAGAAHRPGHKAANGSQKTQSRLSGRSAEEDISRRLRSVPDEMREAKRWLLWALDDKGSKKPARRAWQKPENWLTFDAAHMRRRPGQHLGFVLGDGWAGIDVDGAWSSSDQRSGPDTMQTHGREVWNACKREPAARI